MEIVTVDQAADRLRERIAIEAPLPDSSGALQLRPASFVASLSTAEYFGMYRDGSMSGRVAVD